MQSDPLARRPFALAPAPARRSPYAQAMFDAASRGFYVPDVELLWRREDIGSGCPLNRALLFACVAH